MKKLFILSQCITWFFAANAQTLPTKTDIISTLRKVNDYWIAQNPTPGNNQWARAAYFTGNMDFYKVYPKSTYLDYTNLWANNNNWSLNGGTSTTNADNQTIGQVYIDLYNLDAIKEDYKIAAIKTSIDNMVISADANAWWWIDALYMAMPIFARLGQLEQNDVYLNKMYDLYTNSKVTRGLYNTTENLWYRDESFDPPYLTPNGEDSYWARGNGWVLAAHARVLQLLPVADIHRAEYIETFQKMAAALKLRQRTDGFWNASLDDPNDFGGPEASGTSFFTYGIAWGINNGYLDSDTYLSVVTKAWEALSTVAVQPNGFLGYVQGVGSNPASSQPVTVTSTADFGIGAFLLAGSEMVKLASGTMPTPASLWMNTVNTNSSTKITVTFNKPIDAATALTPANYTISDGITVQSIAADQLDVNSCVLTVSSLPIGKYTLHIANITAADGSVIEIGESKSFVYTGIAEITSSGYEGGTSNTADKTVDFDLSTRWSANGDGQWVMYDLGELRNVTSVDLAFFKDTERFTYFSIELSENGVDFVEVFNGQSTGTTLNLVNYDFNDRTARYVKIIGHCNSQSTWNSITEARINGDALTAINNPLTNLQKELTLSPNPMKGTQLTIGLSQIQNENLKITISNMTGRQIWTKNIMRKEQVLIVDDVCLSQGLYIVTVMGNLSTQSALLEVK